MKPLGWSGRKNPVQTVLILLLESGLVFLGFQVSDTSCLLIRARNILNVFAILKVVALAMVGPHGDNNFNPDMKVIGVATVYAALSVSFWQIEGFL